MDFEDAQGLCDRIITGTVVVEYEGNWYFVHDPSPIDRLKVQYEYESAYTGFCKQGIDTKQELNALLEERGLWSEQEDLKLKYLQDKLKEKSKELQKLEFKSNEKAKLTITIKSIKKDISKLEKRRSALFTSTADYLANMVRYRKLLFYLTFNEYGERIWMNEESFKDCDEHLINKLLNVAYFNSDINDSVIRELARNEPWRSMWIGSRRTGNLFGKPMTHMTDYQRAIVSWSILYDNVYEHPECPGDDIIENDILLDAWLQNEGDKRKKEKNQNSVNNIVDSKMQKYQTIGVPVDSPEDAKKVYDLNDPMTKHTMAMREDYLTKEGTVKEGFMPDTKRDIQMRKNQLEFQKHKQ